MHRRRRRPRLLRALRAPARHRGHGGGDRRPRRRRARRDPARAGPGAAADVGATDRVVALVRQAAELGADLVKAHPTDDLADFPRVVAAAGVPVLPRGGGRVDDAEVLERTDALIAAGAAGIVYGRNVIQHDDPRAMVRALRAIVHHGASAEAAAGELAPAAA